jgi:transposase
MDNTNTVIIHVMGGVADIYKQPDDVTVVIVDWDNIGNYIDECVCCGESVDIGELDIMEFICPHCGFCIGDK